MSIFFQDQAVRLQFLQQGFSLFVELDLGCFLWKQYMVSDIAYESEGYDLNLKIFKKKWERKGKEYNMPLLHCPPQMPHLLPSSVVDCWDLKGNK